MSRSSSVYANHGNAATATTYHSCQLARHQNPVDEGDVHGVVRAHECAVRGRRCRGTRIAPDIVTIILMGCRLTHPPCRKGRDSRSLERSGVHVAASSESESERWQEHRWTPLEP